MYKVKISLYDITFPAWYKQKPVKDFLENVAGLEQCKLVLVRFRLLFTRVVGGFAEGEYEPSAENATGGSRIAFLFPLVAECVSQVSAFVTHIWNYRKEPEKKKKWLETMPMIGYSLYKYVNRMLIDWLLCGYRTKKWKKVKKNEKNAQNLLTIVTESSIIGLTLERESWRAQTNENGGPRGRREDWRNRRCA